MHHKRTTAVLNRSSAIYQALSCVLHMLEPVNKYPVANREMILNAMLPQRSKSFPLLRLKWAHIWCYEVKIEESAKLIVAGNQTKDPQLELPMLHHWAYTTTTQPPDPTILYM